LSVTSHYLLASGDIEVIKPFNIFPT
jgi:hypothetical protein